MIMAYFFVFSQTQPAVAHLLLFPAEVSTDRCDGKPQVSNNIFQSLLFGNGHSHFSSL
jgi:hypothetical protein